MTDYLKAEVLCEKPMIENPIISIITPVLNGMKYLEMCIQSVLNQGYPYIEHIFIDGGSSDGTLDMLSNYKAKYPGRIRFISEPDRGVGEASNKGLKMARGQIFGWLSSDETYEEDVVATIVEFFKSHPEAYLLFGNRNFINEKGELIAKVLSRDFNLREAINDRHYIFLGTTFYRREVVERVGMFNVLGNELDFCIRVAKVFPMHRIEKVLCNMIVHKDAISVGGKAGKGNVLRQIRRENYLLCRREGASIFAPSCRKYFMFIILDRLGLYYLVAARIRIRLQRYHFVDKVLRILGV